MVNWQGSVEEALHHIAENHGNWVVKEGVILFPRKVMSEKKERMETLGDLIKQINDIETIWGVCWDRLVFSCWNEAQSELPQVGTQDVSPHSNASVRGEGVG